MGFERLEQSLVDVIKEEQAKLGFREENIRLYYPLSSLKHFFEAEDTEEEMAERLEHLPGELTAKLGEIEVSHKKERFCFLIPPEGSVYVHEHTADNEFIRELIALVGTHGCTLQDIIDLFEKYTDNVICEKIDNGEFDYLLRFPEEMGDSYYYCFKDEGCHIIYHRFLPEDYADFGF